MPPLMSGGGAAGRAAAPERLPAFLPPAACCRWRASSSDATLADDLDLLHDDRLLADAAGAQEQVAEQSDGWLGARYVLFGVPVIVGERADGALAPVAVDRGPIAAEAPKFRLDAARKLGRLVFSRFVA